MNLTANAEARIKQLCCLGLGGEAIMPAVLAELHELIPSYANGFTWSDPYGEMGNTLVENIDEVLPFLPIYFDEFYNRRENEVILSFQDVMLGVKTVLMFDEMLKVSRREYFQHDYYNLFCRMVNFHTSLIAVARESGVALGGLVLHRCEGDPEFNADEKRLLATLMPFIAHALTAAAPSGQVPLVDSGYEGFVIADPKGRICHLCKQARRLLMLAGRSAIPAGVHPIDLELPTPVIQICRGLTNVFGARESAAAPPVCHYRNGLGGFSFRAHWLSSEGIHEAVPELAPLIGIHIRHQEPLPVRVIRRLRELPNLSRRQMQICLLLVESIPNAEIARRMNMSTCTVVTHTRRIYDKLDVHDRAALTAKLTSASDVAQW
ncbi:MAG: helix-turn-helix transcriptional regulator [Marinobacter sp.]